MGLAVLSLSGIPARYAPRISTGFRPFHFPRVKSGNGTGWLPFVADCTLNGKIELHTAVS
jgi:hypothetical protein